MKDLEPRQELMLKILKVLETYSDGELLMVVTELYKTDEAKIFEMEEMDSSALIH